MKNKTIYIILIFSLLMCNCNNISKENSNSKNEIPKPNIQVLAEGPQLTDKNKENDTSNLSPMEIGKNMALKAKGVLGKNLMEAITSKGTEHALSFCSLKAIPLTDNTATSLNATIRRVSDKNRNPENKPNKAELGYIEATKLVIAQGNAPKPQLTSYENKHIGYYPILTNNMCMQCHGQLKTEILPKTLSKINELYPNDLATGYNINELRGIWVIEMEKQ